MFTLILQHAVCSKRKWSHGETHTIWQGGPTESTMHMGQCCLQFEIWLTLMKGDQHFEQGRLTLINVDWHMRAGRISKNPLISVHQLSNTDQHWSISTSIDIDQFQHRSILINISEGQMGEKGLIDVHQSRSILIRWMLINVNQLRLPFFGWSKLINLYRVSNQEQCRVTLINIVD